MSEVALIDAIKRGDIVAVRKGLAEGANLHEEDSQGWTPLFHAAGRGNLAIVRLLISAGTDLNYGSQTGFTALFSAVLGGHCKIVKELLGAGAKAYPVQGTALRCYAPTHEIRDLLDTSRD